MALELDLIQRSGLLAYLPDETKQEICSRVKLVSIPANTLIFDCGSACVMLPLVLNGSVRVYRRSESGREISLYRVTKDQLCIVTLSCLLGGDSYPASGVTEATVEAIALPDDVFHELISTQRPFRESVFHLFSERISGLMELVNEIAFRKLDQRLARFLLLHGPLIEESHQEIADELGSVREIVSRLLKQFEDNGWIALARKQVQVIDTASLAAYAEGNR